MRKVAADVLAALILVSLFVPATVQSKNGHAAAAAAELGKFVRCNSDGFVNVISVQESQEKNLCDDCSFLFRHFAKVEWFKTRFFGTGGNSETQSLAISEHKGPMKLPVQDFSIVFVLNMDKDILERAFHLISAVTRTRRSVLFVKSEKRAVVVNYLREIVAEQQASSHFFLAVWTPSDNNTAKALEWLQLISLKHEKFLVANSLNFSEGGCIKEFYDLQGLMVTSTSLTWKPYLTLEDCDQEGQNCAINYGMFNDLAKYLSAKFNMSFNSGKDPDNDWGTYPKNGSHDFSGHWGGAMGDVIQGRKAISLNSWLYISQREPLLDFVIVLFDRIRLVLTPQPAEVDPQLFLRPFTTYSWVLVASASLALLLAAGLPSLIFPRTFPSSDSYKLVHLSGMGFVLLVNAYYGGAMTMFFSSEPTIPLSSLRDVMRDSGGWRLVIRRGSEAHFFYLRDAGDPDYIKLFKRIKEDPEKTVFSSVEDGMAKLREGRFVLHIQYNFLLSWLKNNPHQQQNLHVFGGERPTYYALILTKNSPLTPVFKKGVLDLRENSLLSHLAKTWIGEGPRQKLSSASKLVLKPGQVILAFFIIFAALIISILIFLGEHVWKKLGAERTRMEDFSTNQKKIQFVRKSYEFPWNTEIF